MAKAKITKGIPDADRAHVPLRRRWSAVMSAAGSQHQDQAPWWAGRAAAAGLVVLGLVGFAAWAFVRGPLGATLVVVALAGGTALAFYRHGAVVGLGRILGWPAAIAGALLTFLGGASLLTNGTGLAWLIIGLLLLVFGWLMVRDPSPAAVIVVDDSPTDLDQLEQLGRLRDTGVLTAEEFEARKRALLDES